MKMIRIFLFLVLAQMAVLASRAQEGYIIEGNIPESQNGKFIYLYGIDYSDLSPKIRDSATIEKGKFIFKGKINTPAMLASIYLKESRKFFAQFFIENKKISVTATLSDSLHPVSLMTSTNNPVTVQFDEWRKKMNEFNSIYRFYAMADSLEAAKAPQPEIDKVKEEISKIAKEQKAAKIAFIESHPDYYLSLVWFRYDLAGSLDSDPVLAKKLFDGLDPALRNLPEGKGLQGEIAALTAIRKGNIAPGFTMQDENGKMTSLAAFRGKYVLVDFWASWCLPCIEKLPEVKKVYATYHAKGLEMISVSLDDDRKKWLDAIKKHEVNWVNTSELQGWKGPVVKQYNIKYIPKTILLDKKGKIIAVDPDLAKDVALLLKDLNHD